jgi:hypothetical protein
MIVYERRRRFAARTSPSRETVAVSGFTPSHCCGRGGGVRGQAIGRRVTLGFVGGCRIKPFRKTRLGFGLAFVTATIAALAGVAERESGLASGLSNTARYVGAALGVAVVSTVAVSRSEDYLAANEGADPLVVLNEGFQSAFLACVVLAGIGMALALLLLGRPRKAPQARLEPAPATAGDR